MTVIGVLACQIFEEELAEIFYQDKDIHHISILRSAAADWLWENLLTRIGKKTVILDELCQFVPDHNLGFELLVEILPVSLHVHKDKLYSEVLKKIKDIASYAQVIFISYGQCGNSLDKLAEAVKDLPIPIVMLTNFNGERVDDCICTLLGGTDKYLAELKKETGTWFMTSGWVKHWETLLLKDLGVHDIKKAKLLFEKACYKRVLTIVNGFEKESFFDNAHAFANQFNFYLEKKEGSLELLNKALLEAKLLSSENLSLLSNSSLM